jgi:hypothetical protein
MQRSSLHETSQGGGDACAQPNNSEHGCQDKIIKREYLAQQGNHTTTRKYTLQQIQHKLNHADEHKN